MSETIVWVRSILETMARTSLSEMIPPVLLGRGGGESPGALNAKVRYQFHPWPRPLTWRESMQESMVTRQQAEYEWDLPSDSDRACPRVFSTCCDDYRRQWRGCSRCHSGFQKRCGCSWHRDEGRKRLDLSLLQMSSWSGKLVMVITQMTELTLKT